MLLKFKVQTNIRLGYPLQNVIIEPLKSWNEDALVRKNFSGEPHPPFGCLKKVHSKTIFCLSLLPFRSALNQLSVSMKSTCPDDFNAELYACRKALEKPILEIFDRVLFFINENKRKKKMNYIGWV